MCTLEKRGDLFILTITGGGNDQHRLNPTRIDSIRSALARVKSESKSDSSALITTAQGKFFSNGYDLDWALSDPTRSKLVSRKLRLLVSDLISLPMPTIAAVTGHAAAGGFILALCHDYLLMRSDRGFLYMSELDIRLKIPIWFVRVVKSKVASPKVWRDVVLKATKITAVKGVEWGIVDSAHGGADETVGAAERLGVELVKRGWDGNVYADNRRTVFADLLAALRSDETVDDMGETIDKRAFSAMKIVKTVLRNKMEEEFLANNMVIYIERELSENVDIESIIDEFYSMKNRRAQHQ